MAFLRISELYIYPVKSLGGISLTSAQVKLKGLEHDRRWMLIDENNQFLTQRVHNQMALFKTSFIDQGFRITYKDQHTDLPFTMEGDPVRAKIWDDEVTVREVSAAHSEWFSKNLNIRCRLVAFPEENERAVDPKYKVGDDHVSLADGYPVLFIGQSSLDDLNQRMKIPLPINRFRPNVVFTGGDPFDEDSWSRFSIGSLHFAGVKPCKRCVMTTVDQETAQKGIEPLVALSKFRKVEGGVIFGQNVIPFGSGTIAVGDEIIVNN